MKKKRLIGIILLVILLVVLIAVIAIGIRFRNTLGVALNWDNIVSFVNSQRLDSEDIKAKMEHNENKMKELADDSPHINIRGDFTPEEKKAFSEGKITREDAVNIIKGETTLDDVMAGKPEAPPGKEPAQTNASQTEQPSGGNGSSQSTEPQQTVPTDTEPVPEEPKDRASEIVAELYVIQAEFIAELEAIGDLAYADYKATHYDRSKVVSIVDSYMGTASALEAECDNKVNTLLKELKAELEKAGGDQSVVKEIRNFYYNEKSLKKSYYLNRMYDEDYK